MKGTSGSLAVSLVSPCHGLSIITLFRKSFLRRVMRMVVYLHGVKHVVDFMERKGDWTAAAGIATITSIPLHAVSLKIE
jgi:hypothetical protein